MRVFVSQINFTLGDLKGNFEKICSSIAQGRVEKADIILFSEAALCGYLPKDLLLIPQFCLAVEELVYDLLPFSKGLYLIVGTVRQIEKKIYNSAAIIADGKLVGYQDKSLLPTYDVFDEARYFTPASSCEIWHLANERVAITICEDIWQHRKELAYERDPVEELKRLQPTLLLNLSASPYSREKKESRRSLCRSIASTLGCPVIFCNQVGGHDGLLFDGASFAADSGGIFSEAKTFEEDFFVVDTEQRRYIYKKEDPLETLFKALTRGVKDYLHKQGVFKAVLGLSGGIDSALVACLAKEALGAENVTAIAMPSRYSSPNSLLDAELLAKRLGVDYQVVSIEKPFQSYLDLLTPSKGNTEENLQARIRSLILMAHSNEHGSFVLSTGNKSELAVGYTTLYGDMCGSLCVIGDLTKTKVYALARWINSAGEIIPENIFRKPPSAELRADQRDSDSLPDYSIIDTIIEEHIEKNRAAKDIAKSSTIALELIESIIDMIYSSEFKRQQAPPILRVTTKNLSLGRNFPIVQKWKCRS